MSGYLERLKQLSSSSDTKPGAGENPGSTHLPPSENDNQSPDKTDKSTSISTSVSFVGTPIEGSQQKIASANDSACPPNDEENYRILKQAIDQVRRNGWTCKISSGTLGCEIWLVADKPGKHDLQEKTWYDGDPILTLPELDACKGLNKEDLKKFWLIREQFGGVFMQPPSEESCPLPLLDTDKCIRCGDCAHFQPDEIGDGSGIGYCRKDAKPTGPALFPRILRYCDSFHPKREDEEA